MAKPSKIDKAKVIEEFDRRAVLHGNNNAVLDANRSPDIVRQNLYRDYLSKQLLLSYLRPARADTVVDYGCGVGRLSRFIGPKVTRVYAFDNSIEMLRVAKDLTPPESNVTYTLVDTTRLPVEDSSVSKFFTFWVLQHADDDDVMAIMQDARRVLKPGGMFLLFEQVKEESTMLGVIHHMRTVAEYKTLARRAGLQPSLEHRVFRFPSYAMTLWQNNPRLPAAALPLLSLVEKLTVNRKPETIVYSTYAMVFKS